ncbi:DUF2958 domain-containing protein [Microvirga sp. G4-2]|uniref:DUF2958 domain-containing protein n=1 Tax=Microvirga sp. G4-2 TaxID=3434467 RepID=UPI0040445BEE
MSSSLFTENQRLTLVANGLRSNWDDHFDPTPVVKLFTPDANCTWLLSELDPTDQDRAFGLCDLGLGCPELGYVSLIELARIRGPFGLPVEQDRRFRANKPLSAYAAEAQTTSRVQA